MIGIGIAIAIGIETEPPGNLALEGRCSQRPRGPADSQNTAKRSIPVLLEKRASIGVAPQ